MRITLLGTPTLKKQVVRDRTPEVDRRARGRLESGGGGFVRVGLSPRFGSRRSRLASSPPLMAPGIRVLAAHVVVWLRPRRSFGAGCPGSRSP